MSHILDKTTVKRILQLHQLQGLSPQIIGQRFGFTTARIYNIIRRQAPQSPKLQAKTNVTMSSRHHTGAHARPDSATIKKDNKI
jgi:transposase